MADNTRTLELTIKVLDDGSVVVDTVKGKVQNLGDATKKASEESGSALGIMKAGWLELAAGVTAGYFTIKKGIDVITGLVNVAAEAEQIEKRAAFQIETWGYKFQEIKPYVDAFAESIQRTTRFSSEMAQQGLGQIMQYTSSIEEGMRGVQIAMDITTQTGKDFNSMIQLVGMAMNGNVEMLGKWIPELKNLDDRLGANATEAEKWAYTQGLLNKMFGGAAQKDLQGYSGQLANLKNQWDELKKSIGIALMPAAEDWLLGAKSLIGGLTPSIEKSIESLKKERENLEAWLKYGVEEGASTKYIEDYKRRIDEVATKIEKLQGTSNAVAEATKKAAEQAARIPVIGITPPEEDWIKKWVEGFDDLTYSYEKLGIISQKTLSESAANTLMYMESVKKAYGEGRASVLDYMNALKAANDAMKKLSGEDLANQRGEAWDKNAEAIKNISKDEEGWLKKVNKANDDLFKSLKDLDKLKIPTHADVSPMEREVNESKRKLEAEGITLPIRTSGEVSGGGGMEISPSLISPTGGVQINAPAGWSPVTLEEWKKFVQGGEGSGYEMNIGIYGIGSSRKPISEKIQEIIGEFGGLENAMKGMEAEINVAELSMEYQKLDDKLKQVERIIPDMSAMASWAGGSPYVGGPIVQTVTDLIADYTEQMKIIQMKTQYEMMKMYGGSMQAGGYVPATGLYTLHEGERVTTKNQISMGGVAATFYIQSTDPKRTADEICKVLKYHLHGELNDLLKSK
jgi:hypothetical protein